MDVSLNKMSRNFERKFTPSIEVETGSCQFFFPCPSHLFREGRDCIPPPRINKYSRLGDRLEINIAFSFVLVCNKCFDCSYFWRHAEKKERKRKVRLIIIVICFWSQQIAPNFTTLHYQQWHSHQGGQVGQSAPLTAKNLPKIGKKREKSGKESRKRGKVLSLCPSWQIEMAMLLSVMTKLFHKLRCFEQFFPHVFSNKTSCLSRLWILT